MKKLVSLVLGMSAFMAVAPPVVAKEKVTVTVDLAVKVEPGTDLAAVVSKTGVAFDRALIAERDIWSVTVEQSVDVKDLAKMDKVVEDAMKQATKDKRVLWAVELGERGVRDDRFHAWPATDQVEASNGDLVDQPAYADLELDRVHERATGDGVVVAVLDTGVEQWHPLLRGHVTAGYDFVNGDDDAGEYADGLDNDADGAVDEADGHGTFVAGVVRQVAPEALIMPVRVLDAEGDGHLYAIIDGIDYAVEHGASVINMSFGVGPEARSKALDEAVKRARDANVIVVAAAGNNGDEAKHYPASTSGVISVTSLDLHNTVVAKWATRGKWVTVAAPGFDIVSSTTGGGYAKWAGTSMAAPVVSGGYALIFEYRPDEKAKKIESILLKSTRELLVKDSAKGSLDLLGALS